jgi:hypothetical protein
MKGLDAPGSMPQRLPVKDTWKRSYMSIKCELVAPLNLRLWWTMRGRLSDLIALAEAGLQAEKDEDDIGRLSELIIVAEAGL